MNVQFALYSFEKNTVDYTGLNETRNIIERLLLQNSYAYQGSTNMAFFNNKNGFAWTIEPREDTINELTDEQVSYYLECEVKEMSKIVQRPLLVVRSVFIDPLDLFFSYYHAGNRLEPESSETDFKMISCFIHIDEHGYPMLDTSFQN